MAPSTAGGPAVRRPAVTTAPAKGLHRRQCLCGAIAVIAAFATPVYADPFPTKPISLIVPGPPGGGTDLLARQLAEAVRPILGVRVIVENKSGAGGALGVTLVTEARPDGYTLGFTHNGPLTSVPNTRKVAYTPTSYLPLVQVGYSSYVMCVAPSFPADNARQFLDALKKSPSKYTYGTDGVGGTMQLAAEQIFQREGVKAIAVPFGGAGETARNFLGGHVDIYGGSLQAIMPDAAAGKAKCLLLTSKGNNPAAPQASGVAALGMPDTSAGLWWGLIGPKDLPKDIAATLVDAFTKAGHTKLVQDALDKINAEPVVRGSEDYRKLIDTESAAFAKVAEAIGLKK